MAVITLAVTAVLFAGILRLLTPAGSRGLRGVLPNRDRPIDGSSAGRPTPRGVVLAALAAATLADAFGGDGGAAGAALVLAFVSAIGYRWAPRSTGLVLGGLGSLAALTRAFGDDCTDVADERRAITVALVVGGIALLVVLRVMFASVGIARGDPTSLLVVFGVIALAGFVASPFGLAITELVDVGPPLLVLVAGYGLVVAAAALLPRFTSSVIGIALLSATLATTVMVSETCAHRSTTILVGLVAFAVAWWILSRGARS